MHGALGLAGTSRGVKDERVSIRVSSPTAREGISRSRCALILRLSKIVRSDSADLARRFVALPAHNNQVRQVNRLRLPEQRLNDFCFDDGPPRSAILENGKLFVTP